MNKILIFIILAIIYYYYISGFSINKQYIIKTFDVDKQIHSKWKHKWERPNVKNWKKHDDLRVPFVGAAIFKHNNIEYLYVAGGKNQLDSLLLYNPKTKLFDNHINITNIPELDKDDKETSYGIISIDLDKDGKNDLLICRENGLYLYKNKGNLIFEKKILIPKDDKTFPMSITIGDYNKDNKDDIYVSKFIKPKYLPNFQFNNENAKAYNTMLKNISTNEELLFEDVTDLTNTKGLHNTFQSVFADINNDKYPDLILSNDTNIIEILENDKNGRFNRINDEQLSNYGMWMGVDISDIDNDGDFDIFFTNVGKNVPAFAFQAALNENQKANNKHLLLRNDGKMKFIDIGKEKGIADESFGWGGVFQNINYDEYDDLVFANNYIDLVIPINDVGYTGIYNTKSKKYDRIMKYFNPLFGTSNIRYDFNKDGKDDIVWINANESVIAYINKTNNNYINVELPQITKYNNAIIKVYLENGKILTKQFLMSGSGFLVDHSSIISFGLGKKNKVKKITIENIYDNDIMTINNPKLNTTIKIKQ